MSGRAGLRHEDVARAVGVSVRTISRWAQGTTGPQGAARERLLGLAAVVNQLSKVLQRDAAEAWFLTPNPLLDFDLPIDLIKAGEYKRVLAAIEGLEDGIFI